MAKRTMSNPEEWEPVDNEKHAVIGNLMKNLIIDDDDEPGLETDDEQDSNSSKNNKLHQ